MNRIYTRTGDKGMTAIHGGDRVSKTDIRIEANGTLDEFNVSVGSIRTALPAGHDWQTMLHEIQMNVMTLMSIVATPYSKRPQNPNRLPDSLVEDCEKNIDAISEKCSPSEGFILPGGTPLASLLHQARVAARKAERRLWALNETDRVPDRILSYVNRLSDLFFVMARFELQSSGCQEELWRKFGYKRDLK